MDTVTNPHRICLAQEGGMGIIHRNMSIESSRRGGPVKKSGAG
jgi:IMP dehydrogenase/GMP reductase